MRHGIGLRSARLLAAGVALIVCGCVEPPSWYPFEPRLQPRVFVSHAPLIPAPGSQVTIVLHPDLAAGDSVVNAWAILIDPDGGSESQDCVASAGFADTFACTFALGSADDGARRRYRGGLTIAHSDSQNSAIRADADYEFSVADLENEMPRLLPVRVPVAPRAVLAGDRFALATALVRDPSDGMLDPGAYADSAWKLIFEGLLGDPLYRWRSNQLAFYHYTEPGSVTDYYSGLDTRCGQNPWPRSARLPTPVHEMDAIGVLHRRTDGGGGAGAESAGGSFRDCAGRVVRPKFAGQAPPPIATFSTQIGTAVSSEVGAHEFGHAVFGLSDEYYETTASRTATAQSSPVADINCCCVADGQDGGVTPGNGGLVPGDGGLVGLDIGDIGGGADGSLYCLGPDGNLAIADSAAVGGQFTGASVDCSERPLTDYPAHCGAGLQDGGCPSLRVDCLKSAMWLDPATPPPDDTRDNLFDSQGACEAARDLIVGHPGIEDSAAGVLANCTHLCGPDGGIGPCPCEPGANYWRLDRSPSVAGSGDDVMGSVQPGIDHGGACARCVETSLCVRWERARGRTLEQVWEYCEQPPANIVELQQATVSLVDTLVDFFRRLFGGART